MEDKKFWNWCTFSYDFWHYLEYFSYKHAAENICDKITDEEKILEIACGTGILTNEIVKRYPNLDYTAVDYSQKMIDICRAKKINAKFEIMDATNLQFPDSYFDIVIIANTLHIIPNPNIVILEMMRCLNENGTFYAPNFLTPTTFKEKFILDIIRKFGYHVYNEYDVESYIEMLSSNGLVIDKTEIFKCFRTLFFVECSKSKKLTK